MRLVLAGILAYVLTVVFLAAGGFGGILFLWLCALGALFFAATFGLPILIGITLALEGLGGLHFGMALVIGFLSLSLRTLFADRLRFTGEGSRFVMAAAALSFVILVSYGGIGISSAWGTTLGLLSIAAVLAYAYTGWARQTHSHAHH